MLFPLLLLAGMLLPIDGGPGWLQTLSKFNPLTYVVNAERALFNGDIWASTTVTGAVAAAGVGALWDCWSASAPCNARLTTD